MRRFVLGVATLALATMTLSWAMAGDQDIARKITEQLRKEQEAGNLRGFNINLKVAEGNVRLEGQVSGEEQQELASDVARRVDGVKNVVNDLVIRGNDPAGEPEAAESETVDDAQIAAQIARALSEKKDAGLLKAFSVDVKVEEGQVTMAGVVTSMEQRALALEAAESATGVKGVLNQLTVKAPRAETVQPVPTPELAQCEPRPADETADSVSNAIYQAEQAAAAQAEQQEMDRQIGETLTQALQDARDRGYMEGFGIGVHVDNGFAWLKGNVSSEEQKTLALEIARRIPGVRQVINGLTIAESPNAESQLAMAEEIGDGSQTANVDLVTAVENQPQAQLQPPMAIGPVPVPVSNPAAHPGYVMVNSPMPQGMVPAPETQYAAANQTPRPLGATQLASYAGAAVAAPFAMMGQAAGMGMGPAHMPSPGYSQVPARYDHPNLPGYAWPSYAAHPNYAAVTYPKQYSPTAWPYIGPFYPYPQVPLGWRKVTLKWDDGWWQLDFNAK